MFRFADTKVNNGSCAAAANRAEPIFGLRVLVLSILGLILSHAALGMKSQA